MSPRTEHKSSIDFLLAPEIQLCRVEPQTVLSSTTTATRRRTLKRPRAPRLSLGLIQQPVHAKVSARSSGHAFMSEHRPIQPPPVLQLWVPVDEIAPPPAKGTSALAEDLLVHPCTQDDPAAVERAEELSIIRQLREHRVPPWTHYSTFFVLARLITATGDDAQDLLLGTTVSAGMPLSLRLDAFSPSYLSPLVPIEAADPNNFAIAFVFGSLATRRVGRFKLQFNLFEAFQGQVSWRNSILSDEFQVFSPKKFPGSSVSTPLTSFLFNNGARIRQRKSLKRDARGDEDTSASTSKRQHTAPLPDQQRGQSLPPMRVMFNPSYQQQDRPHTHLPELPGPWHGRSL